MRDYAIVLAADLPSAGEVLSTVKQVGSIVDGIKVGVPTLLESGRGILQKIRDLIQDRPLLVDLKVADIGFGSGDGWDGTNAKIIKALADSGATHVTVHGFPGPVSIAEAVQVARDAQMGVLLLPLMSHPGAGLFFSRPVESAQLVQETAKVGLNPEFPGYAISTDITSGILLLGEALGVDGYIGPATSPDDLKRYRSITKRPIWCPGFGRQDRLGRTMEVQLREWAEIVGPASAAIVGSAIFKATDKAAAAKEIVEFRDRAVAR
jgi:orotidine 5'-phosphate decarboxylase subfamily 1